MEELIVPIRNAYFPPIVYVLCLRLKIAQTVGTTIATGQLTAEIPTALYRAPAPNVRLKSVQTKRTMIAMA
jgi:hypothetical protein